ncbi:unnamed protein product [Taenia asiatica]|uniref:Uncharacterized protein n=1 Tax=Taenia asiatica TaxID=60517 RepID=A0A3P6NK56_TAEAS|nr:unnamed protein product [Taenia asiatica]
MFAQIRTYCRDGIGLAALNAISCWLLAYTSASSEQVTTLSAFSLASSQSPSNPSSPLLSPTVSQIVSDVASIPFSMDIYGAANLFVLFRWRLNISAPSSFIRLDICFPTHEHPL